MIFISQVIYYVFIVMLNQNKIWVGGIALLFSSSLSAQPAGLKENLKNYFLHQLEKKSDASLAAFSQKKALKWKEAQKYQTLVWKAWQEANAQLDEEKLIPLRSLCPKNKGMWHLPASLEPSAVMPYYWGIKWNEINRRSIIEILRPHQSIFPFLLLGSRTMKIQIHRKGLGCCDALI